MTEPTDLLEHAMGLFAEPATEVAEVHALVARRQRNRRLAAGAVVLAIWLVIAALTITLRSHDGAEPVPMHPPVTGWPKPGPQPAGTYSWDAQGYRHMQNKTPGSGVKEHRSGLGLSMYEEQSPKAPKRGLPVTIDGYDGVRWRTVPYEGTYFEHWLLDIDATPVSIILSIPNAATDAKVDETHAIIDSIRVEAQEQDAGFRLVFDLPAGWRGDGLDYAVPPAGVPASSAVATPSVDTEAVFDWPDADPGPAGTYSWDAQRRSSAINNTASLPDIRQFPLKLRMETVRDDFVGGTAIVIDGYEGMYRALRLPEQPWILESWTVDIDGTLVRIELLVRKKASEAVVETNAIIDSIRVEPQDQDPGFKLVFELPDGWRGDPSPDSILFE